MGNPSPSLHPLLTEEEEGRRRPTDANKSRDYRNYLVINESNERCRKKKKKKEDASRRRLSDASALFSTATHTRYRICCRMFFNFRLRVRSSLVNARNFRWLCNP
ncbi:hypothetical protein CEXT_52381 [Caerostris extrusa]|uniref:Uncharacterized protein n=1 Tax=Caerostris extrusa TaxID=172846 RepID=A0AAV4RQ45_CAEEX|nr:hypothetical protein CEXT_52381 [Caerostris extrusa]